MTILQPSKLNILSTEEFLEEDEDSDITFTSIKKSIQMVQDKKRCKKKYIDQVNSLHQIHNEPAYFNQYEQEGRRKIIQSKLKIDDG